MYRYIPMLAKIFKLVRIKLYDWIHCDDDVTRSNENEHHRHRVPHLRPIRLQTKNEISVCFFLFLVTIEIGYLPLFGGVFCAVG